MLHPLKLHRARVVLCLVALLPLHTAGAQPLPEGWEHRDVGHVGAAGDAIFDGTTFTVRGSGADIWGTADAFHYAYTTRTGDFDVEARVASVENVHQWTKAGLMIRNGLGAGAAHVSIFATPSTVKGISYQTRHHDGDDSLERSRISLAPPVWIKLMRRGSAVQAAYRRSATGAWTLLPSVGVVLGPTVHVGFAVTSHLDGTVASAAFTDLRISDIPTVVVTSPASGEALVRAEPYTIRWMLTAGHAEAWHVWFSPDSHTFRRLDECAFLPGQVRECTWSNPGPPTEQGLIRVEAFGADGQALDVGHSGQFSIRVPPGPPRVVVLQPRADDDLFAKGPYRIMWDAADDRGLARFDISLRKDPSPTFSPITECANLPGGSRECTWNIPDISGAHEIRVVATDIDGLRAEARSGVFHIETTTAEIPPPWTCGDIGDVAAPGACRGIHGEDYEQIEVDGSGADIWGTADEFSYARQDVDGSFSFTARVNSVENVHRWTKAGLMLRRPDDTAPASSQHASLFVTPTTEKGIAFQRRTRSGGTSTHTAGPAVTAPVWLKLVRRGVPGEISAFYRKELRDPWVLVGRQSIADLPSRLAAMLVVSSHVDGTLATANFESITVDALEAMQSADIGGAAPGSTDDDGATIAIRGDGADIWGTADAFRFHYARWSGDGTIIARVRSLEATHRWAKAGVMIRESTHPGAKHAMVVASASMGLSLQYRNASGGTTAEAARTLGSAPVWLRLTREGDRITAYYNSAPELSPDGHLYTWEHLGSVVVSMNADVLVGLAVTSHAAGTLTTAVFDDVLITRP